MNSTMEDQDDASRDLVRTLHQLEAFERGRDQLPERSEERYAAEQTIAVLKVRKVQLRTLRTRRE